MMREPSTAVEPRACPVCGAQHSSALFHQEFSAIDGASLITGYDVVVCDRCGAGFASGLPSQDAFNRYYREMSKYEYDQRGGEESEYDRARMELIADVIQPHLRDASARILDVGCASGRLLAVLRDRGFSNVAGIDPSPACADAAQRLYGVPVATATIATYAPETEYDLVILVGVLEHVADVAKALSQVSALLAPNGLLYLEVPDALTFADWDNAPFQDFSNEHINFFAPRSLVNAMGHAGFSLVELIQNSRRQSFDAVMSNISATFRKDAAFDFALQRDEETERALGRYIELCTGQEDRLRQTIQALVDSREPVIVWGVGTHTTRLMATTSLGEAEIVAFVDSNSKFQGRSLGKVPIVAPSDLATRSEAILISSRVFQREIATQIRETLRLPNRLISLYEQSSPDA